jgi:hypothetical protein
MFKKALVVGIVLAIALAAGTGFYLLSKTSQDKCQSLNLKFDYNIGESVQSYYKNDSVNANKFTKQAALIVVANQKCFNPSLYEKMMSGLNGG